MALIFNLEETIRASRLSKSSLRDVLDFAINTYIPKNSKSKFLKVNVKSVLQGTSFIVNHKDLLADKRTSPVHIDQYIILAGKRDYHLYKMYKYDKLPLSYYPDLNLDAIKYNPLLNVENNEISFKYEPK